MCLRRKQEKRKLTSADGGAVEESDQHQPSHHEISLNRASSVDSMKVLCVASSGTCFLLYSVQGRAVSENPHMAIVSYCLYSSARVCLEDEAGGVTKRGTLVSSSN